MQGRCRRWGRLIVEVVEQMPQERYRKGHWRLAVGYSFLGWMQADPWKRGSACSPFRPDLKRRLLRCRLRHHFQKESHWLLRSNSVRRVPLLEQAVTADQKLTEKPAEMDCQTHPTPLLAEMAAQKDSTPMLAVRAVQTCLAAILAETAVRSQLSWWVVVLVQTLAVQRDLVSVLMPTADRTQRSGLVVATAGMAAQTRPG